jgi:uncharacterized membrane protein YhaH (DUF805 family)
MEFGQAIGSFFNRYVDFQGRSSRSEYWWFVLFNFLVSIPLIIMDAIIGIAVFQSLWTLGLLIGNIALFIRRLHDTDRSGFWLLGFLGSYIAVFIGFASLNEFIMGLTTIAAIGMGITLFVFSLLPGTTGANRFGPNPLDNF